MIAQKTYVVPFHPVFTDTDNTFAHLLLEANKLKDCLYLKNIPQDYKIYGVYSIAFDNPLSVNNSTIKDKHYNKLHFYVGVDKEKKEKYVIIDGNFNLDLSDDSIYTFPFKHYGLDGYRIAPFARIPIYPYSFNGSQYVPVESGITIFPYIASDDENSDDYYLNTDIATNSYARGDIDINNIRVRINEKMETLGILPRNINNNNQSYFNFVAPQDTTKLDYSIGDTVNFVNRKLYLEKVESDQLFLKDLGALNDSSHVGGSIPNLHAYSLDHKQLVHVNECIKNKYVLIDFWGSWCGPCIASIPKIIEVYQQIKEYKDAMILGVALERDDDIEKAKAVIQQKNIEWLNIWGRYADTKKITSIHGKLKIASYPTLLVVDKDGLIKARSDEMPAKDTYEARQKVIDVFLSLVRGGA